MTDKKSVATMDRADVSLSVSENDRMFALIERAATDKNFNVDKLRAMLDFKRELMKDQNKAEADQAMGRVRSQMPRIKKNGLIDFGKGQKPIPYGKWEDIDAIIRPIYQNEGFTVSYDTAPAEIAGWTRYIAIATHANGHEIKANIPLPLDTSGGKQNIQGAGSSSSYGVRYSTKLLFNLVFEGEDDDGKLAAMQFISLEQVEEIGKLIDATKTSLPGFLQMFELSKIDNMTKENYAPAINMLKAKRAKQKEPNQ